MEERTKKQRVDLLDLPPDVRTLVNECELTGRQTVFERNGRAAAILVSYDEYLALRETIEISNDAAIRKTIEIADEQANLGKVMLPEDLFGE